MNMEESPFVSCKGQEKLSVRCENATENRLQLDSLMLLFVLGHWISRYLDTLLRRVLAPALSAPVRGVPSRG
jgi:hypothetical protein